VAYGELSLENDGRNGERCTYLVCNVNGKWLKDLNPLCWIVITLNVKGRVGHVM
jgi:hypothetical protein